MIVVKLQGGLGNQMFQYAAARGFAKPGEEVYLDHTVLERHVSDTDTFTGRRYALGIFKKMAACRSSVFHTFFYHQNTFFFKFLRKILRLELVRQDEDGCVDMESAQGGLIRYLDGYFQSEQYFRHVREELLKDFEFPPFSPAGLKIKEELAGAANAVSVHVRRGDYLKPRMLAYHGVLPLAYYRRAMRKLEEKVTAPHYFIFSEDREWCEAEFGLFKNKITIVNTDKAMAWEDMALMRLCKHHIIANSSYSWWGAWLNADVEKVVIGPEKWFAAGHNRNADFILPDTWIRL